MISARKFYSATRTSRFATLKNVVEHITGNNTKNIIILSSASGNTGQDSDTENISGNFDNDNAIFEPVGELKIDDFVNISSETEEKEDDRLPSSKLRRRPTFHWKKDSIFRKQILFIKVSNLARIHDDLVFKSPVDSWKGFI